MVKREWTLGVEVEGTERDGAFIQGDAISRIDEPRPD